MFCAEVDPSRNAASLRPCRPAFPVHKRQPGCVPCRRHGPRSPGARGRLPAWRHRPRPPMRFPARRCPSGRRQRSRHTSWASGQALQGSRRAAVHGTGGRRPWQRQKRARLRHPGLQAAGPPQACLHSSLGCPSPRACKSATEVATAGPQSPKPAITPREQANLSPRQPSPAEGAGLPGRHPACARVRCCGPARGLGGAGPDQGRGRDVCRQV